MTIRQADLGGDDDTVSLDEEKMGSESKTVEKKGFF